MTLRILCDWSLKEIMKKHYLILLIVGAILGSCNTIYSEKNEEVFGDMMWFQKEIINFNPEIEDTSAKYSIDLTLSHFYQLGLENFPILVKITTPSGKESASQHDLVFKDKAGESLTSCSGDYCDLTQTIQTGILFKEKGLYNIEIIQPQSVVKAVTSLRLAIVKE